MKKQLPSLLAFVFFSLASFAQEMKIISFNIRYANQTDGNNIWELRRQSVQDFINYESPDFFGLQEAVDAQVKDFEKTATGYKWIGVGRDDGKNGGEFTPLFYDSGKWELLESGTFWLSETPEAPSSSWDAALPRICTWGAFRHKVSGAEVGVFNTHFDHVGKEARLNSARLILDKMGKIVNSDKVILIGDFNAEPESPPISALTERLIDTYSAAASSLGQVGTFNGFNIQEIPSRRIDYVFTSEGFRIKKYETDSRIINGRYLSDHFPVIVELELK
ncbi:MAG: endonuclease/exonuclease/phosphatase family protein [Cyclobacteriaceae bacterium]